MILLKPSKRVKSLTGLNFVALSDIITSFLEINHSKIIDISIDICKSRTSGESYCYWLSDSRYKIELDLDTDLNPKYIIQTILHEIRHCMQYHLFNYWEDTNYTDYTKYWNSREEKDARNFERITSEIFTIYKAFIKGAEKFKKYKMGSLI